MRVLDICAKSASLPGEAVLHELCCKRVMAIAKMFVSARICIVFPANWLISEALLSSLC